MASKKSSLLSSLAAYGDDSEQDSDPDTDDQGFCVINVLKLNNNTSEMCSILANVVMC